MIVRTPGRQAPKMRRGSLASRGVPVRRPVVSNTLPYLNGEPDGLGFSLKPPKFIRKAATAVKKAVTLKRVLTAGAIVGTAIVAGPAALAVAKAGAKYAGKGIAAGARGISRLVRRAPAGGKNNENTPEYTAFPSIPSPISAPPMQNAVMPQPTFDPQPAPISASLNPGDYGGSAAAPTAPRPTESSTPTLEPDAPKQAGIGAGSPLPLVLGAAAALFIVPALFKRNRK